MLADWLRSGLSSRRVTTTYPYGKEANPIHRNWRTVPVIVSACKSTMPCRCGDFCPTQAITCPDGFAVQIDVGSCIGCGRCVNLCPQVFAWSGDVTVAASGRRRLISVADGGEMARGI